MYKLTILECLWLDFGSFICNYRSNLNTHWNTGYLVIKERSKLVPNPIPREWGGEYAPLPHFCNYFWGRVGMRPPPALNNLAQTLP